MIYFFYTLNFLSIDVLHILNVNSLEQLLYNKEKHIRLRKINNFVFLRNMNAKIKGGVNTRKGRKRDKKSVRENGKGKN
jgi:hypothetical protein